MKNLLLTFLFTAFSLTCAHGQVNEQLARADSLFNSYEQEEALTAYNQVLQEDPDNLSALWHSSLLYSRLGNRFEDEDKKKAYFNNARDRAQQALDVAPNDSQANFVMAVAMGRMALIVGAKERVAASRDIKRYADRALEADSSNAGAWHVLGRWNFEISNLNFAERLAANVLFGGIPDGASTQNAVKNINKAIELNPDFVLYYYDLAKAYEELGQEQEAIAACRKGLQQPTHTPDDAEWKEGCRDLIEDLE